MVEDNTYPHLQQGVAPSALTGWQVLTSNIFTGTQDLSWNGIRDIVRQGYGKKAFPVGSQFLVKWDYMGKFSCRSPWSQPSFFPQ